MIPFLSWSRVYLLISTGLLLLSVLAIGVYGFRYSVEFVGGSQLRYQFSEPVTADQVRATMDSLQVEAERIEVADDTDVTIRTQALTEEEEEALRQALDQQLDGGLQVLLVETVGPSLSVDNLVKTSIAVGLGVLGILAYVLYAFRSTAYAVGAVAALFHDIIILIGSYALASHFFGAEIDSLFITAALTTMSFSVHDTIVMFDQMRMYRRKKKKEDPAVRANMAVSDTMMRSINNSMTIVFMLVALLLLGGETIRFFAFALLVGTIIGTYSSPFVSIPIAVWIEKRQKNTAKKRAQSGQLNGAATVSSETP